MRTFYFGLLFFVGFIGNAQTVDIPDANFKNALVATNCVDTDGNNTPDADVDTNDNGEVEVVEALAVTNLRINNQSIADLTGINSFLNLSFLRCDSNNLTDLTLTDLLTLYYVECGLNQISTFNIVNCSLYEFHCSYNAMTTLDLSQTQVAKLYVSNCPNLAYINIKNSRLIEGNILGRQDNTALPGPPPLPPLAISNNPNLTFICCDPDEVFMVMNHGNFYSPIDANISVSSYCTFAPGGGYNTIMGSVTLDCGGANVPMSLQRITIDDGLQNGIAFTNGIGNYVVYAASGTQTVTLQSVNPAYFTATPANYTFNFSGTGTAETADFCLQPNGVRPDLEVTILPLTAARPGFGALYKIVYHNQGNQVQSGSVVLTFDDVVLDVNLVVPTATTSTANTITWDFSNLNPFENREITINFQINSPTDTPPVNIGDVLHYTVALNTAETDETPADNQMTFNQTTVGSFDPNDKAVVEGAAISTSQIDDYLHYVVRFQNTGTAAAENIVVKDLLETNLDWSTLQMVSSSHSYRSTLTAGNRLEVFYEGINLPPSSTDEQGSHGYIAFKIKPKSTVVENDVIQNTANIYFDFNFPIVTNTVATTVSNLGTPNFNQKKLFTVYPNPTNNILNISLSDNDTITAVTICNTLGQKVMNDNVKTLDVSSLTAGTYLITVATDKGKATQKIIKL